MNPTRKAFLLNTFGLAEHEVEDFVGKLKDSLFGDHSAPAATDTKAIEDRIAALELKQADADPAAADVETMKADLATLKDTVAALQDDAKKTADHIALVTSEIDDLTAPDKAASDS